MRRQPRFERFQALEEGAQHQTHTHRRLVPGFHWYPEALWQGCGLKHIAHDAVSSCFVSAFLSQNIWEVSRKVAAEGSATLFRPRDHIHYYERGISYAAGKFWDEAMADFQAALAQYHQDERRART